MPRLGRKRKGTTRAPPKPCACVHAEPGLAKWLPKVLWLAELRIEGLRAYQWSPRRRGWVGLLGDMPKPASTGAACARAFRHGGTPPQMDCGLSRVGFGVRHRKRNLPLGQPRTGPAPDKSRPFRPGPVQASPGHPRPGPPDPKGRPVCRPTWPARTPLLPPLLVQPQLAAWQRQRPEGLAWFAGGTSCQEYLRSGRDCAAAAVLPLSRTG